MTSTNYDTEKYDYKHTATIRMYNDAEVDARTERVAALFGGNDIDIDVESIEEGNNDYGYGGYEAGCYEVATTLSAYLTHIVYDEDDALCCTDEWSNGLEYESHVVTINIARQAKGPDDTWETVLTEEWPLALTLGTDD